MCDLSATVTVQNQSSYSNLFLLTSWCIKFTKDVAILHRRMNKNHQYHKMQFKIFFSLGRIVKVCTGKHQQIFPLENHVRHAPVFSYTKKIAIYSSVAHRLNLKKLEHYCDGKKKSQLKILS